MGTKAAYDEGREQYEYQQDMALSCQGKSAETLTTCGEGQDYCKPCFHCGKPVCDEHRVQLFGLADYCFPCAKAELDAADLTEAEEREAA